MTKEDAEKILCDWGEWQRGAENLLHSKTNILGKKVFIGGKYAGITLPDMSPEVEFAEQTICKMCRRTQKVVRAYYIFEWSQEEISYNYRGLKRSEVRSRLDAAANFLAGAMSTAA